MDNSTQSFYDYVVADRTVYRDIILKLLDTVLGMYSQNEEMRRSENILKALTIQNMQNMNANKTTEQQLPLDFNTFLGKLLSNDDIIKTFNDRLRKDLDKEDSESSK